ncbi:MAG: right-handed parallel beta-helix repeat-containing protein [Nitrososphaerota archaeon]|nr:right-handed parallel beta-helix repeat-containing protein [Nitrososphaerota archaeon]
MNTLNNSINGKPLVVLEGQSNQVVDGAAQVILVNCRGMVVQNVVDIGLNKPIQLYGVTDSVITKCESHISLVNSDNNLLVDNEFSKTGGTWQSAAVLLSNSHSNTVMQNVVVGVNSCGIIVTGSNYNKIEKNSIKSTSISKLDNCAGMTLGGYKNYVYENDIVCEEFGLNLSGEHNVFFKNNVSHGKCSVYLSNALYNDVLGNNLSGASESAVCLVSSDFNNFVWNNFIDNSKVYEIHETYWMTFTNFSYYAEYNKWDNGKEGNYWSDYTGQDTNGYGIGKTVYMVYENFTDNYPLTGLYDISKIQIALEPEVGSSIELPQLPITTSTPTATGTSEGNNSKAFPTTAVIVAVISVAVIVAAVVSVVFLKRAKNEDRTKIV